MCTEYQYTYTHGWNLMDSGDLSADQRISADLYLRLKDMAQRSKLDNRPQMLGYCKAGAIWTDDFSSITFHGCWSYYLVNNTDGRTDARIEYFYRKNTH